MSDLVRTIAFAFRRKGADAMPGTELRYLLAFDLRWFAPEDAKRAVQRALDTGLVREDGEVLRPMFDIKAIEIPVNFRPSPSVFDEDIGAVPPIPVAPPLAPPAAPAASAPTAAAHAAPSPAERAAEDERRKRGLLMGIEVARLVVRRRAGEDVTADAAALEAQLLAADPPRA